MRDLKEKFKKLPDSPGIYMFYSLSGELIYVGKASSLKRRVLSYFSPKQPIRPIEQMIHQVKKIDFIKTDSVLEAIILEGQHIKKYRPKYNILWRDDKSWNYIVITKEDYPKVKTAREQELKLIGDKQAKKLYSKVFGPYPGLNTKAAIKIFRKIFKISSCNSKDRRECLYRQMGECLGVCTGEISPTGYARKVIRPLVLFLNGDKHRLIKEVVHQMVLSAKEEDFEEAARLRDQIKSLKRIQDMALINESFTRDAAAKTGKNIRIEGYDISNIGASNKVGAMVVFDAEGPVKSDYRKFNIYTVKGQSDVACLEEVLRRRLKRNDWPLPDLIFVDGGRPQVNLANKVIGQHFLDIPVIGIAKGPTRKKIEFIYDQKNPAIADWIFSFRSLLIAVRDESHRFAISFHRQKLRSRL